MALPGGRKPIGQILKEMELVTEGEIQEALMEQRDKGGALGQILISLGYVSEDDVLFALSAQAGMDVVNLDDIEIPGNVISRVPAATAQMYKIVPINFENRTLTLAVADPTNVSLFDDLKFMLNCEIQGAVASGDQIDAALGKYYADGDNINELLKDLSDTGESLAEVKDGKGGLDLDAAASMANAAPVVKLLNLILMNAIRDKASDIHFEPFEDEFKVRYRVDGVLYEVQPPPLSLAPALVARVKVMSNLDIAETRMPQDGRIELTIGGRPIDLRVSTLPTMFGESCVMRILDRSVVSLDIENIGLREAEMEVLKALIDKPNGIVLVTGPTGSGKTTTLYSCLNYANSPEDKIITTEDPVEYDLDGIIQCQINEEVGLTYAAALRAILRQDPDKILVGEIRDRETAQIAVEASLTGHLVLSTLHTNDAPSAVTRLLDIGVENFLIAAVLEAIIAQRLVRRVCRECKQTFVPTEEHLMELNLRPEDIGGREFAYGAGCGTCNHTGHKGRQAIFEIFIVSDPVRQLIMDNGSTAQLRDQGRREGMRTLREAGLLAIFDQGTTIEEVLRETILAD